MPCVTLKFSFLLLIFLLFHQYLSINHSAKGISCFCDLIGILKFIYMNYFFDDHPSNETRNFNFHCWPPPSREWRVHLELIDLWKTTLLRYAWEYQFHDHAVLILLLCLQCQLRIFPKVWSNCDLLLYVNLFQYVYLNFNNFDSLFNFAFFRRLWLQGKATMTTVWLNLPL